ncbi:hypothetical protein HPB48_014511 [Haemaphysalis longicornis]|uniref:Uncharacterized protein n=1 Tax=Haemaphysalis longicornis TaxID=44386 RepID=A0A9J6G2A0_HAELO|nr:hypothetical protein HPB48_014511 [Haemaphysalis longicornis]
MRLLSLTGRSGIDESEAANVFRARGHVARDWSGVPLDLDGDAQASRGPSVPFEGRGVPQAVAVQEPHLQQCHFPAAPSSGACRPSPEKGEPTVQPGQNPLSCVLAPKPPPPHR